MLYDLESTIWLPRLAFIKCRHFGFLFTTAVSDAVGTRQHRSVRRTRGRQVLASNLPSFQESMAIQVFFFPSSVDKFIGVHRLCSTVVKQ
jgi:hypothetical protein